MNNIGEVLWNLIEMIVRAIFGFLLKLVHKEFTEEQWEALFQFVKFGLVGVWNTVFNYVIYLLSLIGLQSAGVDKMIEIVKSEILRTMGLLGASSVDELNPEHVRQFARLLPMDNPIRTNA